MNRLSNIKSVQQQLCGQDGPSAAFYNLPSLIGESSQPMKSTSHCVAGSSTSSTTVADFESSQYSTCKASFFKESIASQNSFPPDLPCESPSGITFNISQNRRPGMEREISVQYAVFIATRFAATSPALSRHLIRSSTAIVDHFPQSTDRNRILKKVRRGACSYCGGILVPGVSCITEIKELCSRKRRKKATQRMRSKVTSSHTSTINVDRIVSSEIHFLHKVHTCCCGGRTRHIGSTSKRNNLKSEPTHSRTGVPFVSATECDGNPLTPEIESAALQNVKVPALLCTPLETETIDIFPRIKQKKRMPPPKKLQQKIDISVKTKQNSMERKKSNSSKEVHVANQHFNEVPSASALLNDFLGL